MEPTPGGTPTDDGPLVDPVDRRRRLAFAWLVIPIALMLLTSVAATVNGRLDEVAWIPWLLLVLGVSGAISGWLLAPIGDFGGGVLLGLAMGPFAIPVALALRHHRHRPRPPAP